MNILSVFGSYILALSFPVSLFAIIFSLIGHFRKDSSSIKASNRALVINFILLTTCVFLIVGGFLSNNFSLTYIHGYSSISLPIFFKFTGLWAGLDGSLLFWTWLVSLYLFIVYLQNKTKNADWIPIVCAVMTSVILFFVSLMIFNNNPFTPSPEVYADGKGLNPLLQNIAMVVHPPSLYLGFTGFTVPFAFMVAALVTRRVDASWIDITRRWTIVAWFFLTLGLILGGAWAYVELGWGGFWAWDPVENAALMPWLTATAYIHSVIIQKKRGLLQVWNVVLIATTFFLTILGTYLTRSGVVQSVHAFSDSNLGPYFLAFMFYIAFISIILILSRYKLLKAKTTHIHYLSKESAFLLNNVVLVVSALAVIWGTLFPSLSELITGDRVSVGPPFFNQIMAPIGIVLLFLMGIGPMISWRKASWRNIKTNLLMPLVLGVLGCVVALLFDFREWYVVLSIGGIFFVSATLFMEYYRGIRMIMKQKEMGIFSSGLELLFNANRRYGGYVVHIGVLFIFISITGIIHKSEVDFSLMPGQSFEFKNVTVKYIKPDIRVGKHNDQYIAEVDIYEDGEKVGSLSPSKFYYHASNQPTTEVDIFLTAFKDIYLLLGQIAPINGKADFRLTLNPFISFMWIGGFIILIGVILIILPRGRARNTQVDKKSKTSTTIASILLFLVLFNYSPLVEAQSDSSNNLTGSQRHLENKDHDPITEFDLSDPNVQKMWKVSPELLCQCQGCVRESLKVCTCGFAKKERSYLLDLFREGKSEQEVLDHFVDKYGLTVLTTPPKTGFFQVGYVMPLFMLIVGLILGLVIISKKFKRDMNSNQEGSEDSFEIDADYVKKIKEELEEL